MIYRRNRGLSPTLELDDAARVKPVGLDSNSLLGRTRRWWRGRSFLLASQRVYQTMWLAVLVYAFLGLPVLGRVLNFARFVHRFSAFKVLQGLLTGMLQDVAIFLQASTCICLVKVLLDAETLTAQGVVQANNARSFPNSGFLRERSGSARFLPVYMPVLANEYDLRDEGMEALASGVATNHRTLLSLGAGNRPALVARAKRALHSLLILTLLQLILVAATIASVADFCLQVTMHPRLNRAFVNIFFNYMTQFTASLMDEEVLTRTVVGSWAVYLALVAALTYGFYTGRLPLASDFLRLPSALCCCFDRRYNARKDSMASASASGSTASASYVTNLFASYWHRAGKPVRTRRRSGQNYSHLPGGASGCAGYTTAVASSSSLCSTGYGASTKSGPLTVLARCILASLLVTGAALSASLLVDGKGGVDMKLMNNAMFTLQAEQFFERPTTIHREEINCTTASSALRSTLGVSERYELANLGNDDNCALLWRKTTAYEGESFFELELNATEARAEAAENATADASAASAAEQPTKAQPNIIVLNMESWRHLDVGVLGGAAKKEATGQSATPHFDALAKTGVLYSKHYTQCVQTTRTLLTTLFGMLPSCTETTALKQYSTTLSVRGLPHFLKQRGYFNLFWSAVDLTWEYWDKFLLQNGFDKLVDDRKIRKMLHETRSYKNTPDDHFSWGMHDHLSFEMLLYAIEAAHNASEKALAGAAEANASSLQADADDALGLETSANATELEDTLHVPEAAAKGRHYHAAPSSTSDVPASTAATEDVAATMATKPPLPGWEGLQTPYFIDMYTITSHNPWALPSFYEAPDLSGLYTRYNKKYLDSMYFSDEMLGAFVAALRAKGLMKNTIVIIEGDHGYGRLEHDNNPSIADSGVWDEASRVPFLLLADDFLREQDKGAVVDQLSMQSDLMATIADILGVTPEEPLYQHGYGHSMKRRRAQPEAQKEAQALAAEAAKDKDAELADTEAEALAAEARESPRERRVVMCNPFNGMSKGVRTEELKYIFHPDGSYNVFEPAIDPAEKRPLRTGFDVEEMDDATRDVFEYVTKAVDLNQFLFEANRFVTPLPAPKDQGRWRRPNAQNGTLEEGDPTIEPRQPRGPPAPVLE
jgi:phosphoglycerol transferase MdoB-like AlkP superfamily enzyme